MPRKPSPLTDRMKGNLLRMLTNHEHGRATCLDEWRDERPLIRRKLAIKSPTEFACCELTEDGIEAAKAVLSERSAH